MVAHGRRTEGGARQVLASTAHPGLSITRPISNTKGPSISRVGGGELPPPWASTMRFFRWPPPGYPRVSPRRWDSRDPNPRGHVDSRPSRIGRDAGGSEAERQCTRHLKHASVAGIHSNLATYASLLLPCSRDATPAQSAGPPMGTCTPIAACPWRSRKAAFLPSGTALHVSAHVPLRRVMSSSYSTSHPQGTTLNWPVR